MKVGDVFAAIVMSFAAATASAKDVGLRCHPREARARAIGQIRAAALGLADAWKAKDAGRIVSYFTEDSVAMEGGMQVMTGKREMLAYIRQVIADPAFAMHLTLIKVDASRSDDLGYVRGKFSVSYASGRTGGVDRSGGYYIAVFRKQADGSWKVMEDISAPGS